MNDFVAIRPSSPADMLPVFDAVSSGEVSSGVAVPSLPNRAIAKPCHRCPRAQIRFAAVETTVKRIPTRTEPEVFRFYVCLAWYAITGAA